MDVLNVLIEISVYGTALYLAVLLVRALFRKKAAPRTMYILWALVLLRFLIPATFDSTFHFVTVRQEVEVDALPLVYSKQTPSPTIVATPDMGQAEATQAPVATVRATSAPKPVQSATSTPASEPSSASASASADAPEGTPTGAALSASASPAQTQAPASVLVSVDWRAVALWAWVGVAAAIAAVQLIAMLRLSSRIKTRAADERIETIKRSVMKELSLKRELNVFIVDDINSPALTAELRPKVLLPRHCTDSTDDERIRFALMHELTHYKRGDHMVCMLLMLLRAAYWFNPVVWIMAGQIRADMESACDSAVVEKMNAEQRLKYAGLLLEFGKEV